MGKRIEPLQHANDDNDELPELTTDQPEVKPAKQPASAAAKTNGPQEVKGVLPPAEKKAEPSEPDTVVATGASQPVETPPDTPVDTTATKDAEKPSEPDTVPEPEPEIPAIPEIETNTNDPAVIIQSGRRRHFGHWLGSHKKVVIPIVLLIVAIAALAGVPITRYAIAGMIIKQQYTVAVVDSQTGKPVSSVTVRMRGQTGQTNSQGKATIKVPVGTTTLKLEKNYYQTVSQEVLVPLKKPSPLTVKFTATGRQVPITIVNKISGRPVALSLIHI